MKKNRQNKKQKIKSKKLFNKVIEELNNKFHTECSICLESTNNKSSCRHPICLSFESKINKCPICRKDFIKPARIPIQLSWYDVVENIIICDGNGVPITTRASEIR